MLKLEVHHINMVSIVLGFSLSLELNKILKVVFSEAENSLHNLLSIVLRLSLSLSKLSNLIKLRRMTISLEDERIILES